MIFIKFLNIIFILFFTEISYSFDFITTSRDYALLQASSAHGSGFIGLFNNPAGLSLIKNYEIGTGYCFSNFYKEHLFNISIYDSITSKIFSGGLNYSYLRGNPLKKNYTNQNLHYFNITLSNILYLFSLKFFLGGRYEYYSINGESFSDASFGIIMSFHRSLLIGISGNNVFNPHLYINRRKLNIGVSYLTFNFIIGTNLQFDFKENDNTVFNYSVAIEYFLSKIFILRLAYKKDNFFEKKFLSSGLTMKIKNLSFDIAYLQNLYKFKDFIVGTTISYDIIPGI